jgi:general secretion pathway protein J
MIRPLRNSRGFTLLEILIAMAVFAIMAGMAYAGLRGVLTTRESTEKRAESLAQLQQLFFVLNEDLAQVVSRSVRDELGSDQLPFMGGNGQALLTLTRSVPDWNQSASRSQLQRVAYHLEGKSLYRQVWMTLDRTQKTRFRRQKLLDADQVDIRFFNGDWQTNWSGRELPGAVEVTVTLPNVGQVKRLFTVQP